MRRRTMLLCILTLIYMAGYSQAKNNYNIQLNDFKCTSKNRQLLELVCHLYRPRLNPVLYTRFQLNETLHHFQMHLIFDILKKDNSRMNIMNTKLDGCLYMSSMMGNNNNNIFAKFLKRIRSVSNMPSGCPLLARKQYELRNYTVIPNDYPPLVPQAKWQWAIRIFKQNELFADILLNGAVVYNT